MTDPAPTQPKISDSAFRHAVGLIDAGDVGRLKEWVTARPHLLRDTADEDGSFAGDYFADPRLIWFVAENPIRHGTLPADIGQVTQVLIDLSRQFDVDDLRDQLNYTLALVASGRVARECGVQEVLIQTLIRAGGDPDSCIAGALAHRELDACRFALKCGATLTAALAAGLGESDDLRSLLSRAEAKERQEALAVAAIHGQPECVRVAIESGADPNAFNPKGMHAQSTPLHQAAYWGSVETVVALLELGADRNVRDTIFQCTALQWAEHEGHHDLARILA